MASFYGTAYINGEAYKVENNHVQVEENRKKKIIV